MVRATSLYNLSHYTRHPRIDPVDHIAHLKQTVDFSGLGINIDVQVTWSGRQTRNGLNIRSKSVPAI